MKTEQVHKVAWEDIVFQNRNKEYGAYFIRNIYGRNVIIAALITTIIATVVLAYPTLSRFFNSAEVVEDVSLKKVKYTELAAPPPIDKNTPPPPKVDVPPPVKKLIKFLPPKVTDKEVADEEKMRTVEEVKQDDVGAENTDGPGEVLFNDPVEDVVSDEGEGDVIFTVVEQQASFPGGFESMAKFLGKNVKYPAVARRMGVEGSVFVSFVVDKEGHISDVQILKGISVECDKEAIRVINLMPPWNPGKQNGKPVKSRFVLPIKFKLSV